MCYREAGSGAGRAWTRAPPYEEPAPAVSSLQRLESRVSGSARPLLCPRCRKEMKVVSMITDPAVVDRILRHLVRHVGRLHDPFESRALPLAGRCR